MSDTATRDRIEVSPGSEEMHWFFAPVDVLDAVRRSLDEAGIRHWVGHARTSINKGPFKAMVHMYPGYTVEAVQRAVDRAVDGATDGSDGRGGIAPMAQPLERLLREANARHAATLDGLSDYHFLTGVAWETLVQQADAGGGVVDWENPATQNRFGGEQVPFEAERGLRNLNEECFRRATAALEAGLFGLLQLWLVRDPAKIGDKQVRISSLYLAGDLEQARDLAVSAALDDLKYKRLDEWFRFFAETIQYDNVIDADSLRLLAEMKARRDVLEHNAGVANDLYVNKVTRAGATPRYAAGERVVITDDDFAETVRLIAATLGRLATLAADQAERGGP